MNNSMTHQRPSRQVSTPLVRDIAAATPLTPTWSIDFTQQSPAEAGLQFSRASSAGCYDRNGQWVTVPTNTLRINHNPATGLPYGFLSEGQRTNYLRNSTAPATQTISLSSGTYTLQVQGSGSCTPSLGTASGSGLVTATEGAPCVFTLTSSGSVTFTVGGSLTRFQCENGSSPSSFITTAGATVTRAADIASLPLGNWFNPLGGAFAYVAGASPISNGNTLGLDDASGANSTYVNSYIRNVIMGMFFRLNGTPVADHKIYVTQPVGKQNKVAFSYGTQGTRLCINNQVHGFSSTSSANAEVTTLRIGHRNDGTSVSHINEHVVRVDYFDTILTPNQLQQLTD